MFPTRNYEPPQDTLLSLEASHQKLQTSNYQELFHGDHVVRYGKVLWNGSRLPEITNTMVSQWLKAQKQTGCVGDRQKYRS